MDFRILGPLEVRSERGQARPLVRRKQRLLLAGLLVNANRSVTTERIVDWLWGARPPASAVQNLYSYVSDLRRQLHDGTRERTRIETQPGRYLLRVEPGELDAAVFEDTVVRAARAADDGEPAVAAERFGRALGLWHGDLVLEGLSLPASLRTEALRLEELRTTAFEGSLTARLALGRPEDLVPELETATHRFPLREPLWALLVQALHQAGRQAEALAAFQRASQVIEEELQAEPGEQLQLLYQHVRSGAASQGTTGTRASNAVTAVPAGTTFVRPAELPRTAAWFAGRHAELAGLRRLSGEVAGRSRETVTITTISGMAGIGKTALAVQAAHLLAPDYPDGQIFLDLHGHTEGVPPFGPGRALGSLLRSAGVPSERVPAELDERAALWRTTLAGKRMLIVLDNAASEAQVRQLLPGTPGCLTLITSRRQLAGLDDAQAVFLAELPLPDAVDLFADAVGSGRQVTPADRSLVAEVVELCGRLPLAIQLAAARLRHRPGWTVAQLGDRLRQQQGRLAELEAGERSVAASFRLSYEQLDEEQRRAFRLLGLFPSADIDVGALAALAGISEQRADRLLGHLLDTTCSSRARLTATASTT
ncbi:AfsR/SARP family transcriptional regulator [Flindersiella endophytica]